MKDNEIISGIREARRAFAAAHGYDLKAVSEAAMKFAIEHGFRPASIAPNPRFHYPTEAVAAR